MAIRKLSKKRAAEQREYLRLRAEYLPGKICPVTGEPATQIHHKKGRIGSLLNNVEYWVAVSAEGHKMIEESPIWAKLNGYSLSRLAK